MYELIYSEKSKRDIINIINFIGNLNYIKVIDSIKNTISLLSDFPEMGVKFENGERQIVEPKYKYQIRYVIIGKEIYIMAIYKFKNK